jgi:S1-C subfamily serine protease
MSGTLAWQLALVNPPIGKTATAVSRSCADLVQEVRSGTCSSDVKLESNSLTQGCRGAPVLGMPLAPVCSDGSAIAGVRRRSDASTQALHAGDVIHSAGEITLASVSDLSAAEGAAEKAGRKGALLLIAHDGHQSIVPVHLDEAMGERSPTGPASSGPGCSRVRMSWKSQARPKLAGSIA